MLRPLQLDIALTLKAKPCNLPMTPLLPLTNQETVSLARIVCHSYVVFDPLLPVDLIRKYYILRISVAGRCNSLCINGEQELSRQARYGVI